MFNLWDVSTSEKKEPWPSAEESRAEFVAQLAAAALQRVYTTLQRNRGLDQAFTSPDIPGIPPTEPPSGPAAPDACGLCCEPTTAGQWAAFPQAPGDVALTAKFALVTPCQPELQPLMEPEDPELAARAHRITTQWMRECFGDDSYPRPEEGEKSAAFHCNGCRRALRLQSFRVRCAECDDLDLCEACFCAGVEVDGHLRSHYYVPLGPNQFPLFHPQWTADEELLLLDAVGRFGFGNWLEVSEHVALGTAINQPVKDKEACEKRYFDFHLLNKEQETNELFPFNTLITPPPYTQWHLLAKAVRDANWQPPPPDKQRPSRPDVGGLCPKGYYAPEDESSIQIKENLVIDPPQLPPKVHILGFLPFRGDFENEFENQAELAIADLDIRDNETPMEKQIKLRAIELYNCILDDRLKRKKLTIEKRLFDKKWHDQHDRTRSAEEKSLIDLLRPMWKHTQSNYMESPPPLFSADHKIKLAPPALTDAELEEYIHLLLEDRALSDRLNLLTAWNKAGLRTLEEVLENGGNVTVKSRSNVEISPLEPLTMESNQLLGPLDAALCETTGIRGEFFPVIKEMLQTQVQKAVANGQLRMDPTTNEKLVTLREDNVGVSMNDFAIDAKIEQKATSGELDLIPKKRKLPPRETRAEASSSAARQASPTSEPVETEEGEIEDDDYDETPMLSPTAVASARGGAPISRRRYGGKGEKRRGSGGLAPLLDDDIFFDEEEE